MRLVELFFAPAVARAIAFAFALGFAAAAPAEPAAVSLDPESYTVQLIALPSAERLTAFVRERGVSDLVATEVRRNGESYYVLLLGAFPDRATAQQAADNLPAALSDVTPWVRPMSSLLEAIEGP